MALIGVDLKEFRGGLSQNYRFVVFGLVFLMFIESCGQKLVPNQRKQEKWLRIR